MIVVIFTGGSFLFLFCFVFVEISNIIIDNIHFLDFFSGNYNRNTQKKKKMKWS